MTNKVMNILPFVLFIYLALISPIFSTYETDNCNCSIYSNIIIDETFPKFMLQPTSNERYCRNMDCAWNIQFNSTNYAFMLEIILYLVISPNDKLIINVCDTQNVIYDSNKLNNQHHHFYTQEENLCVYFNSSDQTGIFYWNIIFCRLLAPNSNVSIFFKRNNHRILRLW